MKKLKLFFAICALLLGVSNASARKDVTDLYLVDADLSSLDGWGNPGRTAWKTDGAVNVVEFWNWSNQFAFTQVANLPAGYYRLAVNAFYRNGSQGDGTNNNMAWIMAGEKTQNVVALNSMADLSGYAGSNDLYRAATAFSQGKFSNEFDFNITGEGTTEVEIGFKGTCPNSGWCILGPVKLYEYTSEDYIEDYRIKVAAAEALYDSYMGAGVLAALKAAVVDEATLTTVDKVLAAINNLNEKIAAANTSINSYASLLAAINNPSYTPAFSGSVETYNNAITAAQGVYDAAEVDECTAAINALTNGIHAAYESDYSTFANDYEYDYSTLLSQDLTQWAKSDYVVMTGQEHWNAQPDQRYYEQSGSDWGASAWSHEASETPTLPAGKYVMSITARASADVTSTMSVKVGNNDAIIVSLANKGAEGRGIMTDGVGSYQDGTYANKGGIGYGWEYRFIEFTVAEESPVTIKFNSSVEGHVHNWVSIAAPLLKGDVHPNQIKLNQVKELVATLAEYEDDIPAGAYATFATDITNANNATVESDDLDDIIVALQGDIETAKADADAYADFIAMKAKAQTMQGVTNDNPIANGVFNGAISDATTNVAEAANVEAINTVTSTLKEAMVTYVGAANPVGNGAKFDCTFMLTNPDVTPFWTGAWNVRPEGWYNDQDGGNFQVMANENLGPGGEVFMEYWSESPAQSGFVLCQKVTLSKGTYEMSGRVAANFDNQGGSVQNVFFAANDAVGTQINSETLIDAACEFVQGSADPVLVKIGMIATEGNQARWMAINKIQLFKVPAKTYTVSEDDEWDNSQSGAGDVTLNRTIIIGYNTLVLPFSMTQEEVEDQFGEGSVVYELNSFENEVIGFKTADRISPNKPCILKATEAGTSYDIKSRTIVAGDANPTSTVDAVSLIGSYDDEFIVPQTGDNYVVSKGNLYLVDSEVKIQGTRAYFNVVGNQAREISFDGVLTGIATVEKGELKKVFTGDIFDLTGRKVKNPSNGVFVVEGKKVVF